MATDSNNSRPRARRSRKYHRNGNMKITIESNKTLLDILDDKRKVLKLLIIIVVLAMTIFIGLSFITVSIKSVYPYNSIRVNAFGTTTMQSEDKEIHYWLFNTAELWANSGIHVKEGDKLTIRSSGKFNTAIHHMINAAETNNYNFDWLGPEGSKDYDKRDEQRMDFRIFKKLPANALIMQVVPDTNNVLSDNLITPTSRNRNDIYYIGKERVDLIVQKEGNLHFAVNDIVLTNGVIEKMIKRNDSLVKDAIKNQVIDSILNKDSIKPESCWYSLCQKLHDVLNIDSIDSIERATNGRARKQDIYCLLDKDSIKCEIISKQFDSIFSHDEKMWRKFNKKFMDFGPAPGHNDDFSKDCNEMTYYRDSIVKLHKEYKKTITDSIGTYYNAWFDDNIGSFLIVVEHTKSKP